MPGKIFVMIMHRFDSRDSDLQSCLCMCQQPAHACMLMHALALGRNPPQGVLTITRGSCELPHLVIS